MTKEEFVERALEIKETWLDKWFEDNISNIYDSGAFDVKTLPNHYGAVYPAVAAIFEQVAKSCICGGSDGLKQRRIANKIKRITDIKR